MKVLLSEEWLEEIKPLVKKEDADADMWRFATGRGKVRVSIADWSDASIAELHAILGRKADAGDRAAKLAQTTVRQWTEIKSDPNGQVVGKLENVEPAMKKYIATAPHRYVFEQTEDGNIVPWFVFSINYHEADHRSGRGTALYRSNR